MLAESKQPIPNSRGLVATEVMTSRVYSVTPEWNLLDAAHLLRRQHVSALPVIDAEGVPVGVLSESDLVRQVNRLSGFGSVRGVLDLVLAFESQNCVLELGRLFDLLRGTPVRGAMQRVPLVVEGDAPIGEVASLLRLHDVNRLLVVRDRKLIGIITRQDVVDALARVELSTRRSLAPLGERRLGSRGAGPPSGLGTRRRRLKPLFRGDG